MQTMGETNDADVDYQLFCNLCEVIAKTTPFSAGDLFIAWKKSGLTIDELPNACKIANATNTSIYDVARDMKREEPKMDKTKVQHLTLEAEPTTYVVRTKSGKILGVFECVNCWEGLAKLQRKSDGQTLIVAESPEGATRLAAIQEHDAMGIIKVAPVTASVEICATMLGMDDDN